MDVILILLALVGLGGSLYLLPLVPGIIVGLIWILLISVVWRWRKERLILTREVLGLLRTLILYKKDKVLVNILEEINPRTFDKDVKEEIENLLKSISTIETGILVGKILRNHGYNDYRDPDLKEDTE